MNIRKPTDYSILFSELDRLMAEQLSQMNLYCEIGRLVSSKAEKGAAVAASEYLQMTYPAVEGFSPRNLRRMRAFYAAYEESPEIMRLAMNLGWTQNVAILERCSSNEERAWYIRAVLRFGWKKAKLLAAIESQAWLHSSLDAQAVSCYTGEKEATQESECSEKDTLCVCHGNICRSPMAEFVMKDLVKKAGLASQFHIESAATSREEIGNPVYPPARRKLAEHGISCDGHAARQLTNADYKNYDLLIGMDSANLRDMYRICGGDFAGRLHLLMDYTDRPGDVADPWYTGDFEATWQDVLAGCQRLLKELTTRRCDENG